MIILLFSIAAFALIALGFRNLYRLRVDPEVRDAARQFASDVVVGRTPSAQVTELLVSHDERFDHRLAPPDFFVKYGDQVTYRGAVLQLQEELQTKAERGQARKRRTPAEDKFRQIGERVSSFLEETCSAWDEGRRTLCAINGDTTFVDLSEALKFDVLTVVTAFATAQGRITKPLGRLYHSVSQAWGFDGDLSDAVEEIECFPRQKIELPVTVHVLSLMAVVTQSSRCPEAAEVLNVIAKSAAKSCAASVPVKIVLGKYSQMLQPYLRSTEGASAQGTLGQGSTAGCERCRDAFKLLELPISASLSDVQLARRELAKSFHPDSFGGKRGQHFAEEHLKEINVACDHLLQCRYAE